MRRKKLRVEPTQAEAGPSDTKDNVSIRFKYVVYPFFNAIIVAQLENEFLGEVMDIDLLPLPIFEVRVCALLSFACF